MEPYYDIHCHVFNKDVFNRHIGGITFALATLTEEMNEEYKIKSIKRVLTKINSGLEVGIASTSEEVFDILQDAYSDEFVFTPLMFDLTYVDDNDGSAHQNHKYVKRLKRFFSLINVAIKKLEDWTKDDEIRELLTKTKEDIQAYIDYIKGLTESNELFFDENNYPNQVRDLGKLAEQKPNVKPFFSIDPRRQRKDGENLLSKIKLHVQGDTHKFIGIKLYAPAGFSPTDPILMGSNDDVGIYGFCQENSIPITVHCSNGGFSCFSKNLKVTGLINFDGVLKHYNNESLKFRNNFFSLRIGKAIKERASKLNHPIIWKKVLEKFPSLTINFAHFGGSGHIMEFVNYSFPKRFMSMNEYDFEDLIDAIDGLDNKDLVRNCFRDYNRIIRVKDNIGSIDRKKLWMLLYEAGEIDNWSKAIFDIIRDSKYPNAYSDLSCFSEGKEIAVGKQEVFSIISDLSDFKSVFYDGLTAYQKSKFLYGSDYYLSHLFGPEIKQYFIDFKKVFGEEFKDIARIHSKKFLFG